MRIDRRTGLLVAAAMLTGTLPAWSQTPDLAAIRGEARALRDRLNAEVALFDSLRSRAKQVKAELPKKRDRKLDVPGSPGSVPELTDGRLLGYLPQRVIDDINHRIYMEYDRGYHDWMRGLNPPWEFAHHDAASLRWTRNLFDYWDRDVWYDWSVPSYVWQLYIRSRGVGRGSAAALDGALARIPGERAKAEAAVTRGLAYRANAYAGFWSWLPWVDITWENEAEWNSLKAEADRSLRVLADSLKAGVRGFDAAIRGRMAGATRASLPPELQRELLRRFVQAYFRGARDAKYRSGIQRSSGTGFSYRWRSTGGTGDGYGNRSGRIYQGTGGGRGTGNGRTPRYWDRGSGTGSTGSAGGGSTGTGSTWGGSTGPGSSGGGSTGTGSGRGSSGTGTGSGSGSGSGSGTGSGNAPSFGGLTGTGS